MKDASIVLSDAENLQNPERWFLDAALSAKHPSPHQERAQAQLTKIESVLTRVLPDVTEVRVGIVDRAGEITPCLQVHGPDGWVPYSALGVGYRTTMAWMVDLAIRLFNRYPTLPDPLSGGGVCLVDEIDLHLHPRWQRTLMATLSEIFPNVQFIATAHSPLMVQSANTANVVVLRRRDGRVVIDNDPPNVLKWRVDQILTSDLFGLPSARAPELDAAIGRRNTLLSKPTLTADDEAELAELSNVIGAVPYGDTPEDIEAANTIRLAAKSLAGRR
jgi:predicted ATP-binding protein involved in virulence